MENDYSILFTQVFIASLGSVGLVELIKNFIKTEKTWIYSLIMIPVSAGCYAAVVYCPPVVIGMILTVGFAQNSYQIIIQGMKSIIKGLVSKAGGTVEKEKGGEN